MLRRIDTCGRGAKHAALCRRVAPRVPAGTQRPRIEPSRFVELIALSW